MRYFLTAAAFAASILTISPIAALAVTSGESLAGLLATPIDSRTGYVGEPVTMTGVYSESGDVSGAKLYGTVTSVVHAGQGRADKFT